MQLTDYHAKYFAHELTKRCPSDSAEKLAGALVDAQVGLSTRQIEGCYFETLISSALEKSSERDLK